MVNVEITFVDILGACQLFRSASQSLNADTGVQHVQIKIETTGV